MNFFSIKSFLFLILFCLSCSECISGLLSSVNLLFSAFKSSHSTSSRSTYFYIVSILKVSVLLAGEIGSLLSYLYEFAGESPLRLKVDAVGLDLT